MESLESFLPGEGKRGSRLLASAFSYLIGRSQRRIPDRAGEDPSRTRDLRWDEPKVREPRRPPRVRRRYRSIWISDVHLGIRNTKAEELLQFLTAHDCEYLYLVGDIFDFWQLGAKWYWPECYNDVIHEIVDKAHRGTRVCYIPGNHDGYLREFAGCTFANVKIRERTTHRTAGGRELLVLHGDEFDALVRHHRWLAVLGTHTYDWVLRLNRWLNCLRQKVGLRPWSLATYLNDKVKHAVVTASDFEAALVYEVQHKEVDGIVCGHSHTAFLHDRDNRQYCNTGDWVESCTAVVENFAGEIRLLNWLEEKDNIVPAAEEPHHEDRDRNRRLAAASERRRHHPEEDHQPA